jgi:transaldolase
LNHALPAIAIAAIRLRTGENDCKTPSFLPQNDEFLLLFEAVSAETLTIPMSLLSCTLELNALFAPRRIAGGQMPRNLLEQLRKYTVVVADTGDFDAMEKFRPQDATTNPSLITAASQLPQYRPIVDGVLLEARKKLGADATDASIANLAFQQLAIAFGKRILAIVPGRVSTEVDARLSYDTAATIAQARGIVAQYDADGIGRERVLVKIASTWEGIRAAEVLEKEGIHCNLTLLFGLHQAIAAADAGVTLVSPFVGRILDWYKKDTGKDYQGANDPGVISVTHVYNYYKNFGYKTQVMGASFRNIGEIRELAGCDLLTISPQLLAELESTEGELPRKLSPEAAGALPLERITVDKAAFDRMHAENRMATDKLKEGIEGFSAALVKLESLLAQRLAELEAPATATV